MLQDHMIGNAAQSRYKRDTIKTADNTQSRYEKVPPQPPLIQTLFFTDSLLNTPIFQTRPIIDGRLLALILRWNVTNEDFQRSKFYAKERAHISALRTIRYGEYRFRQLARLRWSRLDDR